MVRKVEVVPYRQEWEILFEQEAERLRRIFGKQLVSVYHFGSTAIPGICAKPIIDIMLTVRDIASADRLAPRLEKLGYVSVGEYGITGRRFFYKGSEDMRTHHLHIYAYDNPHVLRHIAFRDYMRSHPISARRYDQLKEQLARQYPEDMEGYIQGKNEFVRQQEQEALTWWQEERGQS